MSSRTATRTPSPLPERELYTLREAVALGWGGHSTLKKYIHQGKLPASKVMGVTRVRKADLEALAQPVVPAGSIAGNGGEA